MIEKSARRRMFVIICALIALPLVLILSWAIFRSAAENDIGMQLSEGPVSNDSVSRASLAGAAKISRDRGIRAMGNSERSDAAEKSRSEGRNSAGRFSPDIPEGTPLSRIDPPLRVRLAGTLIEIGKNARAILVELDTGRQGFYREGDSIVGATIRKIGTDNVVLEKNGAFQVLRITESGINKNPIAKSAVGGPPATGVSRKSLPVDPVEAAEGPPVDPDVEVRELPFFQPFTNSTGPPVDPDVEVKELPSFEPIINSTGPPVDPRGHYEDLPEFTPYTSENGPE